MPVISMFYGVLIQMYFLIADWALAVEGQQVFQIEPLR
jgi:hypothetical protein